MLLDLIRALAAGVVAGVLPGWFWAGLLCSTTDRAERFAYSTALSLALVPVCALLQSALLGTGVTGFVAVSSVVLVLLGGLAAYVRFGPAGGKGRPFFSPPIPPAAPALALLGAAAAISLWAATGMPSGVPRFTLPMALLIPAALLAFAAGLVHLLSPARAAPPAGPLPETPLRGLLGRLRPLALPAVLLLALAQGYLGPIRHEWPFIRGVDHYSHAVMAEQMLTRGEIYPYLIYPPGFHTMTAIVSRLSGLEPLEIFPVLGPALWLLPALALYALARRLWGWEYGVAAAGLTVVLGGTYYYYHDAMYPNLVASHFLLVLVVTALCGLYVSPAARPALLLAILGSAVVFYHQVASMYAATLLALVATLFLPFLLLRDRRRGLALLGSLALLATLSVVYAWDTYDLAGTLGELLGLTGGSITGDAVGMAVGTQAPYDLRLLVGTMVSQPVAWLGVLGASMLLRELIRGRVETPRALAYLTLLLWVSILVVGSRTAAVGFPQRFGRDLGLVLAIVAAVALVAVVRSLASRRRLAAAFATSLAVICVAALLGLQTVRSVQYAAAPSAQMTITPEIAEAGEWLRRNNEGGNIMVSPHWNQVPSRMMLAMGGYSALQSFEIWQIRVPRDLPPTGTEPPMDVLRVVNDPGGEHVAGILEKYDVRYIVLYKDMPDRSTAEYWRLFEERPDLYERVFENEDVFIVAPR